MSIEQVTGYQLPVTGYQLPVTGKGRTKALETGNWKLETILLLIALCSLLFVSSCAPPIGNISGTGASDNFWVVPHRVAYNRNDYFNRYTDLQAFAISRGMVKPIPDSLLTISIVENPARPDVFDTLGPTETYQFAIAGRKEVVVTYNNLSTRYSVEVLDPYGSGGGNGNGNNGGGLGFKWWDDP